jgi:hypothetical protein
MDWCIDVIKNCRWKISGHSPFNQDGPAHFIKWTKTLLARDLGWEMTLARDRRSENVGCERSGPVEAGAEWFYMVLDGFRLVQKPAGNLASLSGLRKAFPPLLTFLQQEFMSSFHSYSFFFLSYLPLSFKI